MLQELVILQISQPLLIDQGQFSALNMLWSSLFHHGNILPEQMVTNLETSDKIGTIQIRWGEI